jgi:RNA polymerase sigma-70 factor (ECF subfamily)
MHRDDRELVASFLASRGEDQFRAIYARHSAAVFGLASRLVGAADAEDVLQDTWIRALGALPSFAWASSLRTWLCGIAVNCCRERWRRDSREPFEALAAAAVHPERQLDVQAALDRLAPGYRAVVVLHDVYGYTHVEIAAMLDIEPGTSKSQLARARRVLRAWLGASHEGVHDEA